MNTSFASVVGGNRTELLYSYDALRYGLLAMRSYPCKVDANAVMICIIADGGCSPSTWSGYDGKVCGSCSALVNVGNGGTCTAFCERQGLACTDAWDDGANGEAADEHAM